MQIRTALSDLSARLDHAGVDSPHAIARMLLAQTLGRPREWLMAHDAEPMSDVALTQLGALADRVVAREPLAYILGYRDFYDLRLRVDARVLIPRHETEMLVELALERLSAVGDRASVIDVGTGSGAVAIAIAKHAPPNVTIYASDVSADALDVARANAALNLADAARVTWFCSDLLVSVSDEVCRSLRALTANLPYVTREEIDTLPPEIQAHEPRVALDGGDDGLELIRALLTQIRDRVLVEPRVFDAFFEFGATQGAAVLDAARLILPQAHSRILKDLAKLDRVLHVSSQ
jgi:release factor glutamine methyltransferase